jgi:hypothetical protein
VTGGRFTLVVPSIWTETARPPADALVFGARDQELARGSAMT